MRAPRFALPALLAGAVLILTALPAAAQLTTDPSQGGQAQLYTPPDDAPQYAPSGLAILADWSARFYAAVLPTRWLSIAERGRLGSSFAAPAIGMRARGR